MLTVGLFPNTSKESVNTVLEWLIQYFKERNIKVIMPEDAAQEMNHQDLACSWEHLKKEVSLGITLGGDGTLLNIARDLASAGIPVCGINMGQLGFLTEVELPDLGSSIDKLIAGDYYIEERLMLETTIIREGEEIFRSAALNDVVINKGGFPRPIWMDIFIDGELVAKYTADGVIVASPTGSTGYSLSAGGPIINPKLDVLLITPVCPHTLHARPIIVSEKEEVAVTLQASYEATILTLDGQNMININPEDKIIVRRAPFKARFIRLGGKSYAKTLRTKLWQERELDTI